MEQQALHINYPDGQGNYRLRAEPILLKATITPVLEGPGIDTWEGEGGAPAPPPYTLETAYHYKSMMRVRGPKRQTAARKFIPKESITIVNVTKKEEVKK